MIDIGNYGLIAILEEDRDKPEQRVMHFCGYQHPPTNTDIHYLYEELKSDPEFDLIDKAFFIKEATPEFVEYIKEQLEMSADLEVNFHED